MSALLRVEVGKWICLPRICKWNHAVCLLCRLCLLFCPVFFVDDWQGQIINIHPSLLPKYPGLNTHQRVLEAKEEAHGTTIHFVTNELDSGPIIRQESIKIEPNDTQESLMDRIKELENKIYPETISKLP